MTQDQELRKQMNRKRKSVIIGYISKHWRVSKRSDGSYSVAGHGLWDKKHGKDDVKVRVTTEEL